MHAVFDRSTVAALRSGVCSGRVFCVRAPEVLVVRSDSCNMEGVLFHLFDSGNAQDRETVAKSFVV